MNIFPRYKAQGQNYSSLTNIKEHAEHLLKPTENQNEIQNNNDNMPMITDESGAGSLLLFKGIDQNIQKVQRKKLHAPTLQLTGHGSEVFCSKFSPDGNYIASAGFDKQILIWDIFNQCYNLGVLKGHTNAILELHWSADNSRLYTASADKSVSIWDFETQKRIKKFKGHEQVVNTCNPARRGPDLLVSGSDDHTTKIWDLRVKGRVCEFQDKYQVTAVSFNDTTDKIFTGGLDNQIKVYDLRKREVEYVMQGHQDTISSFSLSNDGNYLLSNSMDQTVRCWDVRPFVQVNTNRCTKIFHGSCHNFEKNLIKCGWSKDGLQVTSGSADKYTYIWDFQTRKILHKLGGHSGSVNEANIHPFENIIVTCSSDRSLIVGEIPDVTL